MKDIQKVSVEILQGHPDKFYIFGGEEYGLKCEYLDSLSNYYRGNKVECDKVSSVVSMMRTKSLVPTPDSVYVVRYDNEFLSALTNSYAAEILNCKIRGTLVVIYQEEKDTTKCDKYFPNNTVAINRVADKLVVKYLKSAYPKLDDRCCGLAAKSGRDYGHSRQIAYAMSKVSSDYVWNSYNDDQILTLFDYTAAVNSNSFRLGIAARNFTYLCNLLDNYDDEYDNILYHIMNVTVEMDKLKVYKNADSELSKYSSLWKEVDIYYMFMTAYNELKQWRKALSVDKKDRLIYMFSLLNFKHIPEIGELQ